MHHQQVSPFKVPGPNLTPKKQAYIMGRAFSNDARCQRSFIFNFDYYTVIGDDCAPMPWQLTDVIPKKRSEHIPISRCSSVVALSLSGGYIKKLKNASRRAKTQYGYVYDPWAAVRYSHGIKVVYLTIIVCSGMYSTSNVIPTISIAWIVMIRRNIM
jgi:hypothetical protein